VLSALADTLASKIVVDGTNPHREDWAPLFLGEQNSAGEQIARWLPRSEVVRGFNTVFAAVMTRDGINRHGRPATFLLCGDVPTANAKVATYAAKLGFAPLDAGPLLCSRYFEAMAHLNVQLAIGMDGGTNAAFLYDQSGR
jgi:predicted dinucleotide-binding enzyme